MALIVIHRDGGVELALQRAKKNRVAREWPERVEAERARLRDATVPRARSAYLERAGAEGRKVLEIFDAERKKLGF